MPQHSKPKSNSTSHHKSLLSSFADTLIAMHPCGGCTSWGITCCVAESSEYYKECVHHKVSCDLIITPADFARLNHAKEKIRKQLEEVEEQISSVSMTRICLRKQLGLLQDCEKKMFRRELENIELLKKDERAADILSETCARINNPGVTLFSNNWLDPSLFPNFLTESPQTLLPSQSSWDLMLAPIYYQCLHILTISLDTWFGFCCVS